jgi:hypothetical protein
MLIKVCDYCNTEEANPASISNVTSHTDKVHIQGKGVDIMIEATADPDKHICLACTKEAARKIKP